ncbi:MAG: RsmE family RNA methyltransferase [Actinomycetota bacterium]|jgi:16S rRNA (uracil1498-N3)-methyltransferase
MLVEWTRRVDALTQLRVTDPATPILEKETEHHLRKVLRAQVGEEIVVSNGAGSWSFATVLDSGLKRVSEVHLDPEPADTALYLAPLKGDRSEWVVAKATELGVSALVPLISERLAVKFKGEAQKKILDRWRRISDEATGQCRRTYDLVIGKPVTPEQVPVTVAVADFGGTSQMAGVRAIAIGPEGGWAPNEWGSDRQIISLGNTVLRGETAAIASAALMTLGAQGMTL